MKRSWCSAAESCPTRRRGRRSGGWPRSAGAGRSRTCCCCSSTRRCTRAGGARRRRSCRWGSSGTRRRGSRCATPTAAGASPTTGPASWSPTRSSACAPTATTCSSTCGGWSGWRSRRWREHGVEAGLVEGQTGVWTEGDPPGSGGEPGEARKIGSIGVHVSRGVTTHGLAVNVNNDLQPFEWVVPCGIEGCRVTSLSRELGGEQDLGAFAATVAARFGAVYGRTPVATEPADLGLDLPAARLGIPDERDDRAERGGRGRGGSRRARPRHPLPGQAGRDRGGGRRRRPLQARPQAAVAEGAGAGRAELPAAEGDDRRRAPPHRLRGGQLPQRRRVLGARARRPS